MSPDPTIIVGFFGLLGVIGAAVVTARASRNTEKASPYAALADRVVALEKSDGEKNKRIERLNARLAHVEQAADSLDQAADALTSLEEGITAGRIPPWPDRLAGLATSLRVLAARLRTH